MKNFKEIPTIAQQAFQSLVGGDTTILKDMVDFRDQIKIENPILSEMFWSDFSYEWNKLQSNSFIQTKVLLDTGSIVPQYPSSWLNEWHKGIISDLKDVNIDDNFDLRKFPFSNYSEQVDKLKIIFEMVFKKTDKDFNVCLNIKENLFGYDNFYDNNAASNKKYLITNVFYSACLKHFSKQALKDKKTDGIIKSLVLFYYGKQNKTNDFLFSTYINQKDAKSPEKIKSFFEDKEKALLFRDEDSKYWRFYLSFIPNDLFVKAMTESFDVRYNYSKGASPPAIALAAFTKNNYFLLNEDVPKKEDTVFKRKKIKI